MVQNEENTSACLFVPALSSVHFAIKLFDRVSPLIHHRTAGTPKRDTSLTRNYPTP